MSETIPLAAIQEGLSLLDREIWIVTSAAGIKRGGLCATWVSTASIDPDRPMLLAGLAPNHYTAELVNKSGRLAFHLLRADQAQIAMQFALGSGRERDKLAGLSLRTDSGELPVLADCLAWFTGQVFSRFDAGDRHFYFADILVGERISSESPLRENSLFAAASPDQKRELLTNRNADIALHCPWHLAWRKANLFTPQSVTPCDL